MMTNPFQNFPSNDIVTQLFLSQFQQKFDTKSLNSSGFKLVEPMLYSGVVFGSEFGVASYSPKKLYVALQLDVMPDQSGPSPLDEVIQIFSESNSSKGYLCNRTGIFDATDKWVYNNFTIKNMWFSGLVTANGIYEIINFIGYRVTLI